MTVFGNNWTFGMIPLVIVMGLVLPAAIYWRGLASFWLRCQEITIVPDGLEPPGPAIVPLTVVRAL
jgi:hypothetical protein